MTSATSVVRSELGSRVGGTAGVAGAWPALLTRLGPGVVPPYPGPDIVPLVLVPRPPRLDGDEPLTANARLVVQSYAHAVAARFPGHRYWGVRRDRPLVSQPWWRPASEAVPALLEHAIAPASWCAWSCDVWRDFVKRPGAPPVGWVLSAKRIVRHRGWYRDDVGVRDGGAVVVVPEHRDLVNAWHALQAELLGAPPIDARAASVVVARHFPRGWDAAVGPVRDAVVCATALWEARVADGGFCW